MKIRVFAPLGVFLALSAHAADLDRTASCESTQVPAICTKLHIDKMSPEAMKSCQDYFTSASKAVRDTCLFLKEGTDKKSQTTVEGSGQSGGEAQAAAELKKMGDLGTKWRPIFEADLKDVRARAKELEKGIKALTEKGKKNAQEEILRCGVTGSPVSFQVFAAARALADISHAQTTYTNKLLGDNVIPTAKKLESAKDPAALAKLRAENLGSEGGPVGSVLKPSILFTVLKILEANVGEVLVRSVEAIEHVHVSIAFGVVGTAIDFAIRLHEHTLDKADYVFMSVGAAAGLPKSFGLGLVYTAMLAVAEYYLRSSEQELIRKGYERYEQWFNGNSYEAVQNYAANMDQLYDSAQIATQFHDRTVIHNTPDPNNRGLPRNPNPSFQCPTNHSCTNAAVWPVKCGDAFWF